MFPSELLEKLQKGVAPKEMLSEADKKALEKKLPLYRHAIDLVELAKGLHMEKPNNMMSESLGMTEIQWPELNVLAHALKNLSGTSDIALLAIECSDFSIREKIALAWMLR